MHKIFIVQYISLRYFHFCHISYSIELVKLYVFITYIYIYINEIFNVYYISLRYYAAILLLFICC
jgi:hypothetical protein